MITVYTKPNCPYCTIAKQYLEKNEFEFETVDITENTEAEVIAVEGNALRIKPI